MGCHTWFYAHLPEKQKEWGDELLTTMKQKTTSTIDTINKMSNREIVNSLENDLRWLKTYEASNGEHKIKIQESFGGKDILEDYVEGLKNCKANKKNAQSLYRSLAVKNFKTRLNMIKDCNDISEVPDQIINTFFSLQFGLFIYRDGKIYRETCHCNGPGYNENPVFEKQFSDLFRIHDYEASPCYSLAETLKRCEEYDLDWDKTYPDSDIKINDMDRIFEFWETYPDGIINFG